MSETPEQMAERMLLCNDYDCPPEDMDCGPHSSGCPANYRPAVAAALSKKDAERDAAYVKGLERAVLLAESWNHTWEAIGAIQAEIDKANGKS